MRTKRILGLVFLGLIAVALTGCSKHAQIFWTGAAIGAIAVGTLTSDDHEHHHHSHHYRYEDPCGYPH